MYTELSEAIKITSVPLYTNLGSKYRVSDSGTRATVIPINPDYKHYELGHIISQAAPEVLLGTADAYEQTTDQFSGGTNRLDVNGEPATFDAF